MRCTDIEKLTAVAASIKKAGYEPYDQIYGYFTTGVASYITRRDNARELIQTIDRAVIADFLKSYRK